MNSGKTVFSQLMDFIPAHEFRRCAARYGGERRVRSFSCWDQFLCLAFAQLTYRESLRDIETCLRALGSKLYHLGIPGHIARSTLADANEERDWRIFADLAGVLIATARPLYAGDPLAAELEETAYALDCTTIDLCLSLFPWARYRRLNAAVKMHTLLDLRGSIPLGIDITPPPKSTKSGCSTNSCQNPARSICRPRLPGFPAPAHADAMLGIFYHSRPKGFSLSLFGFSRGGQEPDCPAIKPSVW